MCTCYSVLSVTAFLFFFRIPLLSYAMGSLLLLITPVFAHYSLFPDSVYVDLIFLNICISFVPESVHFLTARFFVNFLHLKLRFLWEGVLYLWGSFHTEKVLLLLWEIKGAISKWKETLCLYIRRLISVRCYFLQTILCMQGNPSQIPTRFFPLIDISYYSISYRNAKDLG